jgi:hypothetical protein
MSVEGAGALPAPPAPEIGDPMEEALWSISRASLKEKGQCLASEKQQREKSNKERKASKREKQKREKQEVQKQFMPEEEITR